MTDPTVTAPRMYESYPAPPTPPQVEQPEPTSTRWLLRILIAMPVIMATVAAYAGGWAI